MSPSMVVMDKGNVKFEVNEIVQVIIEVYYVPDLKGQFVEHHIAVRKRSCNSYTKNWR